MKATIIYNQEQERGISNGTSALVMNLSKGFIVVFAIICLLKVISLENNSMYSAGAGLGVQVYEMTLPEVVITATSPAAQEFVYEQTLPEVVIIGKKSKTTADVYEVTLPEVVITAKHQKEIHLADNK